MRLNGWHQGPRRAGNVPGHAEGVAAATAALKDVRVVRGLLDQAEINAVAVALAGGQTLSQVAAVLGVPRDEAERRWGDLVRP